MPVNFQPVPTYQDPVLVGKDSHGNDKSVFNPVWLSWFLQLTQGGLGGITSHDTLAGLQGGLPGQYYHLTLAEYSSIYLRNTGAPFAIAASGSPFFYQNTQTFDIDVIVSGGTITVGIQFSRDNITYYSTGMQNGVIRLSPGDHFSVAYTVAPTMTGVPR